MSEVSEIQGIGLLCAMRRVEVRRMLREIAAEMAARRGARDWPEDDRGGDCDGSQQGTPVCNDGALVWL
jgi:hypothetical protein